MYVLNGYGNYFQLYNIVIPGHYPRPCTCYYNTVGYHKNSRLVKKKKEKKYIFIISFVRFITFTYWLFFSKSLAKYKNYAKVSRQSVGTHSVKI